MHEFFLFCFGFWQDCLGCLNQNFILRKILSCLLIPVTEILILNANRHIFLGNLDVCNLDVVVPYQK